MKKKITLEEITPGTYVQLQYFMVNSKGEVYNKYWLTVKYDPTYVSPSGGTGLLDFAAERHIETSKEHLQFFIDNDRIKRAIQPK